MGAICVGGALLRANEGAKVRRQPEPDPKKDRCGDCGAAVGHYHHEGCDVERCPRCGGQAIGCGCDVTQVE